MRRRRRTRRGRRQRSRRGRRSRSRKITESRLRQIIREEKRKLLGEDLTAPLDTSDAELLSKTEELSQEVINELEGMLYDILSYKFGDAISGFDASVYYADEACSTMGGELACDHVVEFSFSYSDDPYYYDPDAKKNIPGEYMNVDDMHIGEHPAGGEEYRVRGSMFGPAIVRAYNKLF